MHIDIWSHKDKLMLIYDHLKSYQKKIESIIENIDLNQSVSIYQLKYNNLQTSSYEPTLGPK